MEQSQLDLLAFCVAALVAGGAVGVFYDLLSSFRPGSPRVFKKVRFPFEPGSRAKPLLFAISFLCDFAAALFAGLALMLVIYRFNDGQLRVIAPICEAAGFFLYRATISRIVRPVARVFGFFALFSLSCVAFLLAAPIKAARKLARRIKSDIKRKKESGHSEKKENYGKEKNKQTRADIDRGASRAFGDSHGGEHNAIQPKARRGGKARGRARQA